MATGQRHCDLNHRLQREHRLFMFSPATLLPGNKTWRILSQNAGLAKIGDGIIIALSQNGSQVGSQFQIGES